MTLPLQTQLLLEQSLEKVRNHPYHYLTLDDRTAIYNSFGPIRVEIEPDSGRHFVVPSKASQTLSWLGIITARKVLDVWNRRTLDLPDWIEIDEIDKEGLVPNDEIVLYDGDIWNPETVLSEMLEMAEGVLIGKIEHEKVYRDLSGRFYDAQTGLETYTIWPVYSAFHASYEALSVVAGSGWNINRVVEHALTAYSGIDLNPPGAINLTLTIFHGFLAFLQTEKIEEDLIGAIQVWQHTLEEGTYSIFYDLAKTMLERLKNFVPYSVDLPKALEFWEWWLTEAIPQAWELAQAD